MRAGPVVCRAMAPVVTKMPAPMTAPTPRAVSWTGPRTRRSRSSPFSSSSRRLRGLRANRWLARVACLGSLRRELVEVRQHLVGMRGRVDLRVGLLDLAVGPDHVADAARGARLGVVAGAVGQTDLPRGVAEQREVVMELAGEGGVFLRAVEADAQDLRALGRVLLAVVAEPATLLRSTRVVGLRVEPQDHPFAAVVRKLLDLARMVLHREIRRLLARLQHADLPSPQRFQPGGHAPHRRLKRWAAPARRLLRHGSRPA